MKKLFVIFISLMLIVLSFVSCNVKSEIRESSAESFKSTFEATESEKKKIASLEKTETEKQTEKNSDFSVSAQTSKIQMPKTTAKKQIMCTFEISCESILNNFDDLDPNKIICIPEKGKILKEITVYADEGSTVFDVLKKVCRENKCGSDCIFCKDYGIQLEYQFTPLHKSYYIEGIHQLYEFDCGYTSGWLYSVNGETPNIGCSSYAVKNNDKIKFYYTCSYGD